MEAASEQKPILHGVLFFFGGPAAFLFRLMLSPLLLIMYHEDIKREPGKNIVNYKNCIIERFSMLSLR